MSAAPCATAGRERYHFAVAACRRPVRRNRYCCGRPRGAKMMHVAMIGPGYVGLVSGACIADFGHQVACVDKDDTKIAALNAGEIPIYEPGLGELVRTNVAQGRLSFGKALSEAVAV